MKHRRARVTINLLNFFGLCTLLGIKFAQYRRENRYEGYDKESNYPLNSQSFKSFFNLKIKVAFHVRGGP